MIMESIMLGVCRPSPSRNRRVVINAGVVKGDAGQDLALDTGKKRDAA